MNSMFPEPQELASTLRMLRAAYPNGLSREDSEYNAVVALLARNCSQRQAARALVLSFGIEYGIAFNDILGALDVDEAMRSRVTTRLALHGLAEWLDEV